jgi:hypothetical protein
MGKGRFVNQKLGKRTSRKLDLLKSRLAAQRTASDIKLPKKGWSREERPKSG